MTMRVLPRQELKVRVNHSADWSRWGALKKITTEAPVIFDARAGRLVCQEARYCARRCDDFAANLC